MMAEKYMEVDLLKTAIEAEPFFTDSTKAAFRNIINKVPAVDTVEVVRCKDCKHNPGYEAKAKNMVWCRQWRAYVSNTGFCSYGERRKDDGST